MIYRFKYLFQSEKNKNISSKSNIKDNYFSFYINEVVEKDNCFNLEVFILNTSGHYKKEEEIIEKLKLLLNTSELKLLDKIDLFEECEDLVLYHGTTKESFKGKNSYIYLTTSLSHAMYHAKERSTSENENPLILKLNFKQLKNFDLIPDNDIDNSWGYISFKESLEDIGSLCVLGDITIDMFEIVNVENSEDVILLVESIHRNSDDFTEGDVFERIDAVSYYELVDFPIELLDLDEWGKDEDLIDEYSKLDFKEMPPIVVHKYSETMYSIVDGVHRANAINKKGIKTIKAYLGKRN